MISVVGAAITAFLVSSSFNANQQFVVRKVLPRDELLERRRMEMRAFLDYKKQSAEMLVERMYRRYLQNPDVTVNFLVVSGGGQKGAFGSGFLVGWSGVEKGLGAMPLFDGVTGVSVGSIIAPFAYIGKQESLKKIDHFFRNPDQNLLMLRNPFRLLPHNSSLLKVSGLERSFRDVFSLDLAENILKSSGTGRTLLVQSTNLDLASPKIFNFILAAKESLKSNSNEAMVNILMASTAIPGLFPPREMRDGLYVDGGVEGNLYYGGHPSKPEETFGGIWKRKFPNIPIPLTRYWVIVNSNLPELPMNISPGWASVAARSLDVKYRSAEVVALRELYAIADLTRFRGLGDVEVRWVAINEPIEKPGFPNLFEEKEMRRLSDLGRRRGGDLNSWNLVAP